MTILHETTQALQRLLSAQRQDKRLLRMSFPRNDAPADALLVANRLNAHEALSKDFRFEVEVLSDQPDIALDDVLGKMVTVELKRGDGSSRYFNGYVFDFRFNRNDAGFSYYDMVLLPWLAFLRYRRDNFLFHGKTVAEQTALVFEDYDFKDWKSRGLTNDAPMTEATQFDESDYNYVHRRWEAKGWHYHYEHRADGHTLMLSGDSTTSDPIVNADRPLIWQGKSGLAEAGIWSFSPRRNVASSRYASSTFDFKTDKPSRSDANSPDRPDGVPPLEVYEYAGAYGYPSNTSARDAFVRLRIEEIEAAAQRFEGTGDDDRVQAGGVIELSGHLDPLAPRQAGDDRYLVLEARHAVSNNFEKRDGGVAEYRCDFGCTRQQTLWRPGRNFNSTEPRIYGVQTAIVVGPAGEEIHTDEYGRVRVQFHWDREGKYDEASSTWVRVASTWAGANFGFMAIPRIGQEVIVQWLDGNPDRPLITGRVYNEQNMPPWDLPANKTQTGILSRSSEGGVYDNANAFRFEDKKGQEEVWLHAEKDQRIEVENDESHWVGHDRTKTIDHDETVHVKHDRTETVDNNETITVHNNRTERVDANETISIGQNRTEDVGQNETIQIGDNRSVTIGGNKTETVMQAKAESILLAKALSIGLGYQVTVGAAMNTSVALSQTQQVGISKGTKVGKTYSIDAGDEFRITVGKASFVMKSDGTVLINGSNFNFTASGPVQINGKDVDIN